MKRFVLAASIVLCAGVAQAQDTKVITFRFPAEVHSLIVEAFARAYKYQDQVPDPTDTDVSDGQDMIANPQSKEDFFTDQVIKWVVLVTKKYTPSRDAIDSVTASTEAAINANVDAAVGGVTATVTDE